jgi:hypothetical protein
MIKKVAHFKTSYSIEVFKNLNMEFLRQDILKICYSSPSKSGHNTQIRQAVGHVSHAGGLPATVRMHQERTRNSCFSLSFKNLQYFLSKLIIDLVHIVDSKARAQAH